MPSHRPAASLAAGAAASRTPQPAPGRLPASRTAAAAPASGGCGWFDSSHELRSGLAVFELDAADLLSLPEGLSFLSAACL